MNNEEAEKVTSITIEHIKSMVIGEEFYVFPSTQLTVCCLTLKNGFTVTGKSACVDPKNFNKEKGEEVSRNSAINEIWQLEGYLLKQKFYEENN